MARGACWGFLCLHRERSSQQFTPAEVAFISRLTPHIAQGLRKALLLGRSPGRVTPDDYTKWFRRQLIELSTRSNDSTSFLPRAFLKLSSPRAYQAKMAACHIRHIQECEQT